MTSSNHNKQTDMEDDPNKQSSVGKNSNKQSSVGNKQNKQISVGNNVNTSVPRTASMEIDHHNTPDLFPNLTQDNPWSLDQQLLTPNDPTQPSQVNEDPDGH